MSVDRIALEPPVPHDLGMTERVELWKDLMDTCEQFVLAGLRREIGPDGDLKAAYREWYFRGMEEHDRMMIRLAEGLQGRPRGG